MPYSYGERGVFVRKVSLCFAICTFLIAVACTLPAVSWAQTATTGTVIGTISDPSGAAIADATVVLRNRATNNQVTQTTNGAGQYTFVNVAPGEYEVNVKKEGFRSSNVTSLNVEVTKSYTVDVKLEIG